MARDAKTAEDNAGFDKAREVIRCLAPDAQPGQLDAMAAVLKGHAERAAWDLEDALEEVAQEHGRAEVRPEDFADAGAKLLQRPGPILDCDASWRALGEPGLLDWTHSSKPYGAGFP
jgi:hypothetical protein